MLCEKQQERRDAWVKNLENSFNDIAKKGKVTMHEINIVKEMINDIVKYFNREKKIEKSTIHRRERSIQRRCS